MNLQQLARSAAIAVLLAWVVTFLPGLRTIQAASVAGAPLPLPRYTEAPLLAAQDPFGGCVNQARIIQDCTLANLPAIRALEQQVIADLIAIHQLPPGFPSLPAAGEQAVIQGPSDTASRLLSWERDTLRSMLFNKIAAMLEKTPRGRTAQEQAEVDAFLMLAGRQINTRTAEEQAIAEALAARVGQHRLAGATAARSSYNSWRNNPCTFEPPSRFTYTPPSDCAIPNALSNVFSNPPSLEQFQAYGAFLAYERFSTDADVQAAAAYWAKMIGFFGGLAIAGVAAAAGYAFAMTALGVSLGAALFPFAAKAAAAAGLTGSAATGFVVAGAFAAAAAIIVLAVVVAVIAGVTVFTAAEIPGKLDEAVEAAKIPPELYLVFDTEKGKQEIYGAYLLTTFPAPNSPTIVGGLTGWAPVPAARPDDQKFLLDPGPAQRESADLEFSGWNGTNRARLSQGWFVDRNGLTLDLDYINHAGEEWTAWRIGDRFRHTTVGDTRPSFESDVIQYQDASGANRTARIQSATPAITVTQGPDIVVTVVTVLNPAPTFAFAPDDVTVDQTSADGAVVTFRPPSASDFAGDPATVTCAPASGATFPVGRTTVTCTATERTSAPATTTFTVTVRETFCNGVRATIVPRPFDDLIVGTPGNDVIVGTPGNDVIYGGGGDDIICGLEGDDLIYGEGGSDSLRGGDGDDTLDGGEGQDELFGGPGNDTMLGGGANDWLEDREGMSQTFDGGGGDANRCIGVSTAAPAGTVVNCQIRFQ